MKVRTLFISDIHLGNNKSNTNSLLNTLKEYEFENLVILGDFLDLTSLKRKFYWKESHSTVIQKILKLSRKGKKIIYILGNHDHYLRFLIKEQNINLGDILICDDYIYETLKKEKIYICHGDQFDGFIRIHPFIYLLGDFAYELSFVINKLYNKTRKLFGLDYWSLSKYLKTKVKNVVSFLNDFKVLAIKKLDEVKCDSIMMGHTHNPRIDSINGNTYYNTGDFCENSSFLYEDYEGNIHLVNSN